MLDMSFMVIMLLKVLRLFKKPIDENQWLLNQKDIQWLPGQAVRNIFGEESKSTNVSSDEFEAHKKSLGVSQQSIVPKQKPPKIHKKLTEIAPWVFSPSRGDAYHRETRRLCVCRNVKQGA